MASVRARILLAKIMTSDTRAAFLQLSIQEAFVPLSTRAETQARQCKRRQARKSWMANMEAESRGKRAVWRSLL